MTSTAQVEAVRATHMEIEAAPVVEAHRAGKRRLGYIAHDGAARFLVGGGDLDGDGFDILVETLPLGGVGGGHDQGVGQKHNRSRDNEFRLAPKDGEGIGFAGGKMALLKFHFVQLCLGSGHSLANALGEAGAPGEQSASDNRSFCE